jgi:hypothetical protein
MTTNISLKNSTHLTSTGNAVALSGTAPLPAFLEDACVDGSGDTGLSDQRDDYSMLSLAAVQKMSAFCDPNSAKYIEGCEDGGLVLSGAAQPLYKGSAGISVIHCGQIRRWPEFLPNRAGFVRDHAEKPADVTEQPNPNGSRMPLLVRTSNKNIIVDTRAIFLIAVDALVPCVMFCSGSKHFFARNWMTYLSQIRHPQTGQQMKSFARRYRLYTAPTGNNLGRWNAVKFQDEGWLENKQQRDAAVAFAELVKGGNARLPGSYDES